MVTIRSLEFKTDFYWKGDRYRQLIRLRVLSWLPKPKSVTCYKLHEPFEDRVEMPLGRKVKPVIKYELL